MNTTKKGYIDVFIRIEKRIIFRRITTTHYNEEFSCRSDLTEINSLLYIFLNQK